MPYAGMSTINADIVNADMNSITGTAPNNKTLYDIHSKLSSDFASQTTLASILAKIIAAPATAANQATIITALQLIDDIVALEDAALAKGVLVQADDGTDRRNVQVDPDSGAVIVVSRSGLPTYGLDAVANTDDSYATVVTAPARECHYLHVAVESYGAIISLDGGSTEHFRIPANTERLFPGLTIAGGAVIQGKNAVAGEDYTNLAISVW